MRGQLVVIAGPDLGRSFSLVDGQTLVLGRGQNTESRLKDPAISRVHCQVQVDGGKILLSDAGSSSGTQVNGKKLSASQELRPGDVISLGSTQVRYQLEGEPDASTLLAGQPGAPKKDAATTDQLAELVGKSV